MATMGSSTNFDTLPISAGPFVDDGAPHSAIGLTELLMLHSAFSYSQ